MYIYVYSVTLSHCMQVCGDTTRVKILLHIDIHNLYKYLAQYMYMTIYFQCFLIIFVSLALHQVTNIMRMGRMKNYTNLAAYIYITIYFLCLLRIFICRALHQVRNIVHTG